MLCLALLLRADRPLECCRAVCTQRLSSIEKHRGDQRTAGQGRDTAGVRPAGAPGVQRKDSI